MTWEQYFGWLMKDFQLRLIGLIVILIGFILYVTVQWIRGKI